ncbi:MAG TPA: lipoprotein [Sphingopyxis sp.]|nr:lipoprotein [Sphingopyxis sp.]HMP46359.1 lipoprotein [Sphingopyxis sp.]HMQ19389.1 lipoprotein [Sphingopyxis sp.]
MHRIIFAAFGAAALAGCSAAQSTYELSVAEAQERLVNGTYEKGSIKGFSNHNITPRSVNEGRIEWQIRMDDGTTGFRCETLLGPANVEGTQAHVVSQCFDHRGKSDDMYIEGARRSLERLIAANLAGKP